jgi:hypothetical protein
MDNYYKNCPARMDDARFLTDYRTANTREQNIKMINGFVNDDEYRMFLQTNGETLMDRQWDVIKTTNSCKTNCCIHTDPTRSNNGMIYNEMKRYNAVRTGTIDKNNSNYPSCPVYFDYRMSNTEGTKY